VAEDPWGNLPAGLDRSGCAGAKSRQSPARCSPTELDRRTEVRRPQRFSGGATVLVMESAHVREVAPRAQQMGSQELKTVRNCTKDEGWPFGVALQGEASNHLKLLGSKASVVSVEEKADKMCQGGDQEDERERTTDDASKR